jgi:hypothetical protein
VRNALSDAIRMSSDLDPVILSWLRHWEMLFSGDPQNALPAEVRAGEALADILTRHQKNRRRKNSKSTTKGLESRIVLTQRRVDADLGWRILSRKRGGDPQRIGSALAGATSDLNALESIAADGHYRDASQRETRDALRVELSAEHPDDTAIAALTKILVTLALHHRPVGELRFAPHGSLAECIWSVALQTSPIHGSDFPGAELLLELVGTLAKPLPPNVGKEAMTHGSLSDAIAAFIANSGADPINSVIFDLVHGEVVVESADDVRSGRLLVRRYIKFLVLQVLHRRLYTLARTDLIEDQSTRLFQHAQQQGLVRDPKSGPELFGAAAEAAVWLASELAANAVEASFDSNATIEAARLVYECGGRPEDFARRTLHRALSDLFRAATSIAVDALADLSPKMLDDSLLVCFRERWATALAKRAAPNIEQCLPLTPLLRDRAALAEACLTSLAPTPQTRYVTWSVVGIRPTIELWRIGDAELFDPERLNFGHVQLNGSGDKPTTCVRVRVDSESDDDARNRAWPHLERVLDVLSFAFSVQQHAGGLHPDVMPDSIVETPSERRLTGSGKLHRSQINELIDGAEAAKLGVFYDALVQRAAVPEQLSELERRFIHSLSWYRRARWQPDPTRRLLDYWIVIEQFFVRKGAAKESAAAGATELHITWRDIPALEQLWRLWVQVRSAIASSGDARAVIASHSELAHWDRNEAVLFKVENAETLVSALGKEGQQQVYQLFLRDLRWAWASSKSISTALYDRRWACRLCLERVYDFRCGIVHEAASPGLAVATLSDALERIAEDCLAKTATYMLDDPGRTQTLDALVTWWSDPWTTDW